MCILVEQDKFVQLKILKKVENVQKVSRCPQALTRCHVALCSVYSESVLYNKNPEEINSITKEMLLSLFKRTFPLI